MDAEVIDIGRARIRFFMTKYLDYLDGERDGPPSLDQLNEVERRRVERWIKSLLSCRAYWKAR
jgi:hypothetical protein